MISDFTAVKRGRRMSTEELWSELDTISDLLGLDSSESEQYWLYNKLANEPNRLSSSKGILFLL